MYQVGPMVAVFLYEDGLPLWEQILQIAEALDNDGVELRVERNNEGRITVWLPAGYGKQTHS